MCRYVRKCFKFHLLPTRSPTCRGLVEVCSVASLMRLPRFSSSAGEHTGGDRCRKINRSGCASPPRPEGQTSYPTALVQRTMLFASVSSPVHQRDTIRLRGPQEVGPPLLERSCPCILVKSRSLRYTLFPQRRRGFLCQRTLLGLWWAPDAPPLVLAGTSLTPFR